MSLTPEQEQEVKAKIEMVFGLDVQRAIDFEFMKFNDERITAPDNLAFLKTVYESRKDGGQPVETVIAALLYGMRLGELAREYVYRETTKERPLPYGHAT